MSLSNSLNTDENDQKVSSTKSSKILNIIQEYGLISSLPNWNIDYNHEKSSARNSITCQPFSNLNLNSIDEEDAFLYGEDNCTPEEKIAAEQETITYTHKHENRWSDEDSQDGTCPLKLNSRHIKNFLECESQNKFQENINFPANEEEKNLSEHSKSDQNYHLSELQSNLMIEDHRDSVSLSGIEKSNFNEINSVLVGTESHYQTSSEKLNSQTIEKSSVIKNSRKTLDDCSGTSNYSELNKLLQSVLKTKESAVKMSVVKVLNKNIDNAYSRKTFRKRYSHKDFPTKKQSMFQTSKASLVPSKWHSLYTVSLPRCKDRVSYPSRRLKATNLESEKYHSRYSEIPRRYLPQLKRTSLSPDYKRRSSEKIADYGRHVKQCQRSSSNKLSKKMYYKKKRKNSADSFCSLSLSTSDSSVEEEGYRPISSDCRYSQRKNKTISHSRYLSSRTYRSRSRSPGHYTSRHVTCTKKKFHKLTKKTFRRKRHRDNSADSFCSLSLGTSSSDSVEEEDHKWSHWPNYKC